MRFIVFLAALAVSTFGFPPGLAPGVAQAAGRPNLVIIGDSIGLGVGLLPSQSFPAVAQTLAHGSNYRVVNLSVDAITAADVLPTIAASLAPFARATTGQTLVVVIELGANDFKFAAASDTTVEGYLTTLATAVTNAGGTPILATILPQTVFTTQESNYAASANTWIKGSIYKYFDGAGALPDPTNSTNYQSNGIHPTASGDATLAGLLDTTLSALP